MQHQHTSLLQFGPQQWSCLICGKLAYFAVECTPLKRALEATYAAVLPKAAKPFIFLVRRVFFYCGSIELAGSLRRYAACWSSVLNAGECWPAPSSVVARNLLRRNEFNLAGGTTARQPRGCQCAPHQAGSWLLAPGEGTLGLIAALPFNASRRGC